MTMGETVLSAVMSVLIEKLVSGARTKFAQSQEIDSQLKELRKKLPVIRDVLADAGKKQITNPVVEFWLRDLQELAYDIDDALEELDTEALKRKFQESDVGTSRINKLQKFISSPFTHSSNNVMYVAGMSSKLFELTTKANDLVDGIASMGLHVNGEESNRRYKPLEETSLVEVSKVIGREEDKRALLEKLTEGDQAGNQNVSVVSIVGMGGIGKTTLAKVLYDDEKVKMFELRAWICVSDEFDVVNISKAIYTAVVGYNQEFATLDLLHVALKEKLSGKKFLIVLDNVWNDDHEKWIDLKRPLEGAPGSKILVTTRKSTVASVMNSVQTHYLQVLSNDYAMCLFAKYALDEQNFNEHPSLVPIAQKIIKKCDGLPLALIAVGRVLKTKGNDQDEWEELLNSELWSSHDETNILPALKLSYYDLPSQLKQLFAYCSLFPKDYLFNKNELVLLWVAEGFLSQSKGKNSMDSLGYQCFEELKLRSFFQQSSYDELRYTMHDLMSDLAVSVAGEFFFLLDDKMDVNGRDEAFEKLRHFSFIGQRHAGCKKFKELHKATCLRTFLPVSGWGSFSILDNGLVELLQRLQFLRVLSLTNNSLREVPPSICNLKHLRYLNFSGTSIEILPEKLSELYNLQSLLVRDCIELSRLPDSFANLINLRHLDMSNTPRLKKTPLGIGGLTSLQTLSKVCVEEVNGFSILELKDLNDLRGELSIMGLDNVIDPMQAKDANLLEKKFLDYVYMEWRDNFDDSRNSAREYEVFERLRPHKKLKKLKILFYGGMKFPSWIGDPSFDQLTELRLEGCRSCTHLPTLGHLKSLRKFFMRSMDGVKTWSLHGIVFPSLEDLEVHDLEGLEIWSNNVGDGSDRIGRLFPRLQQLRIEGCSEAVLRAIIGMSSSVIRLKMREIKGLTKLHEEVVKHLGAVEDLCIEYCDEIRYLWDSKSEASRFLVSLKMLKVLSCKKLVSVGEKEVNVNVGSSSSMENVLREVVFDNCETLESYNCPTSVEILEINNCFSMKSLTFPSTLKFLTVKSCLNLKSFEKEHLQSFTSLEHLQITSCPNLEYSFSCGLWPPNLEFLRIGMLKKPMSGWGLQNYPSSLIQLWLYGKDSGVDSFSMEEDYARNNTSSTSFLLPPSLYYLSIQDFKDMESISEVLQHLPRLQVLDIISCPKLRDFPESTSSLIVNVYD